MPDPMTSLPQTPVSYRDVSSAVDVEPKGATVYSRVIVGDDGSLRTPRAVAVADIAVAAFGAELEVIHVPSEDGLPIPIDSDVTVLPPDDAASRLISHALESDPPGLLCLASRGQTAISEALFGSVTAHVIRDLHAPLLVVGPSVLEPSRAWRRMQVCLDGSVNAAGVLPSVESWATALDLEVELVHVGYPLDGLRGPDRRLPPEEVEAAEQLQASVRQLQSAGVRASGRTIEHTHAAEALADCAVSWDADLLALATHGRTGLARLLMGSVALDLVRRSTVPVLTLRPERLR
jgi:nucleotide-binding universal stress UspA family protein